jgi:hypothetical protein
MYRNAKLSRTYGDWPRRALLEERIRTAEERAATFEREGAGAMMVDSTSSCSGCHQR